MSESYTIVGNYDLAGTGKFISHILIEHEGRTFCGLVFENLKGDWQDTNGDVAGCLTCQRISKLY